MVFNVEGERNGKWKQEVTGVESLAEVKVVAKAERWRFTAEYNLKVLQETDYCKLSGEIGVLLRREGLY